MVLTDEILEGLRTILAGKDEVTHGSHRLQRALPEGEGGPNLGESGNVGVLHWTILCPSAHAARGKMDSRVGWLVINSTSPFCR